VVARVLVTVSIRCCSIAKPWFARNPAPAAVASVRSATAIGCGVVDAAVLATGSACGRCGEPSPPGKPELAEAEDGGFVTVVVCGDVVIVVAAGRGSTTVMVCGAADATAPVTGSFAFAVSVSVATG
jgi:hypothetical protein